MNKRGQDLLFVKIVGLGIVFAIIFYRLFNTELAALMGFIIGAYIGTRF